MKTLLNLLMITFLSGCASVFEEPAQFGISGFDELNIAQAAVRDEMGDPSGRCVEFAEAVARKHGGRGKIITVFIRNEPGAESHALYCYHGWCADSNSQIPIDYQRAMLTYTLRRTN